MISSARGKMARSTPPAGIESTSDLTPVVGGFHADPSICRVGVDYYLAHSSMEYSPGIPLRHSRDLVHWSLISNALEREGQFMAGHAEPSLGVWAPTLRHRDGVFYLITSNPSPEGTGLVIFRATDPFGPWSDPTAVPELEGIDPDLAWDSDGTCLVTYCAWTDTDIGIKQAAIDLESGKALESPRWIWKGSGMSNPEGPHIYRRKDWWYLIIAEGGTAAGHAVSVARAPTPRGPFQGAEHNPVFTHRSTAHPVQNIGHVDLVENPDGTWAAVYLGARKRGGTPQFHTNGRETFLADVRWDDDWPSFHPRPIPKRVVEPETTDAFVGKQLDPRWVSPGVRPDEVAAVHDGHATLRAARSHSGAVSGLFYRVDALEWRAVFDMTVARSRCRAMLRIDERHWYGLRISPSAHGGLTVEAISHVGDVEASMGSVELDGRLDLIISTSTESGNAKTRGPDRVRLLVRHAGQDELELANLDGRYLTTEVAGGFTGRAVGLVVDEGEAVVHSFNYTRVTA